MGAGGKRGGTTKSKALGVKEKKKKFMHDKDRVKTDNPQKEAEKTWIWGCGTLLRRKEGNKMAKRMTGIANK